VLLPRGARRDLPRLLSYALEDRLLKDPDTQHLTLSHRRPPMTASATWPACWSSPGSACAASWPSSRPSGGYPPDRGRVQTAPADDAGWHLSLSAEGAILRTGTGPGWPSTGTS
jgi:hypothetical protein